MSCAWDKEEPISIEDLKNLLQKGRMKSRLRKSKSKLCQTRIGKYGDRK